jgi:hypothetical protein
MRHEKEPKKVKFRPSPTTVVRFVDKKRGISKDVPMNRAERRRRKIKEME